MLAIRIHEMVQRQFHGERICPEEDGVIKIEFQDDVDEQITNMKSTLSCTGACEQTDHNFGQINFYFQGQWF